MKFLFENFDILAQAPGGVRKLREMILQFAVQGKLVPQDTNDKPAGVLLDKIKAEKERLVKEGKIKKQKPLEPIREEEMPFKLPKGWAVERFGNVTINRDGERIPLSRECRVARQGQYDYYGASGVIDHIDDYIFDKSLLLIGEDGANLINRSTPIAFIAHGKYWVNNHAHVLDAFLFELLKYIELHINSIDLKPYITGTAQPKMNQAKMNSICIPLPPLAEQKRIVVKVDSLMALCDDLEKQQQEKAEKKLTLNKASLHALNNSNTKLDFNKNWHHITKNFALLYSAPENVNDLKQTILQLAVQGKLVPQDPNDEPASVLLEKIKAEKERLVKEGKIKKQKPLEPIREDEIPFELPAGWVWCRIRSISRDWGQKKPDSNFTYIDVTSINKEKGIISGNIQLLDANTAPSRARKIVKEGTVIYSTVRPYLLNIAIVEKKYSPEPIVSTAFAIVHPFCGIQNCYLYYYFRSKQFIDYVESKMIGMAYPAINDANFFKGLVPLPPLAEQKRIVAKVDSLMALCDRLSKSLSDKEIKSEKMLNAVINQL